MTNTEALKKVYEAAGGEADTLPAGVTNLDILNVIAVQLGGEAKDSNADAIAEIAEHFNGGGGARVTITALNDSEYGSNKTFADLMTLYTTGGQIVGELVTTDESDTEITTIDRGLAWGIPAVGKLGEVLEFDFDFCYNYTGSLVYKDTCRINSSGADRANRETYTKSS